MEPQPRSVLSIAGLAIAGLLLASAAFAAGVTVTVSSPANNANVPLTFNVVASATTSNSGAKVTGWHIYMNKDLRSLLHMPVRGAYSVRYCGAGNLKRCRAELWHALDQAGRQLAARQGPNPVSYPGPQTLEYRAGWRRRRVEPYVPAGGNVHFMPNGRYDYDLDSTQIVLSTIERWRWADEWAAPWRPERLDLYRDLAPDCMGRWVVYWRQNMPGFANLAYDDTGAAMKNWWPFLFY